MCLVFYLYILTALDIKGTLAAYSGRVGWWVGGTKEPSPRARESQRYYRRTTYTLGDFCTSNDDKLKE